MLWENQLFVGWLCKQDIGLQRHFVWSSRILLLKSKLGCSWSILLNTGIPWSRFPSFTTLLIIKNILIVQTNYYPFITVSFLQQWQVLGNLMRCLDFPHVFTSDGQNKSQSCHLEISSNSFSRRRDSHFSYNIQNYLPCRSPSSLCKA